MKAFVYKTSNHDIDYGVKRDFGSLDECIRTLMMETKEKEYVVSDIKEYYGCKDVSDCQWLVEIYDYYRE